MGKFRASGMGRVVKCPGSWVMPKVPQKEWDAANEGTMAHGVAESLLRTGATDCQDPEVLHNVALYVDKCRSLMGANYHIEQQLQGKYGGNILTGMPDFIAYNGDTLEIVDFKYGFGWVEAFENSQLLSYAILTADTYLTEYAPRTVKLTVAQPRANHPEGPIRTWEFEGDLLRNHRNLITGAMDRAVLPDPPTKTGEHCRYCPSKLLCDSYSRVIGYSMDLEGLSGTQELSTDAAVRQLEMAQSAAKRLQYYITSMEETLILRAKAGEILPGYDCYAPPGALAWTEDALAMGELMGVDLAKPPEPITPTQAISRKLLSKETVHQIASRKPGSIKLVKNNIDRVRRILS